MGILPGGAILQVPLVSVGELKAFFLGLGLALIVRVGNDVTNGNAEKNKSDGQTIDKCRLRTALTIGGADGEVRLLHDASQCSGDGREEDRKTNKHVGGLNAPSQLHGQTRLEEGQETKHPLEAKEDDGAKSKPAV